MLTDVETLPDDPEALRAIIIQQATTIAERNHHIENLEVAAQSNRATLRAMEALIETLRLRIAKLKRQQFGRSSEKIEREIAKLKTRLRPNNGAPQRMPDDSGPSQQQ